MNSQNIKKLTLPPIIKTNYFWTTAIGKIVREQRLCFTANKELFPPKLPKPSNKNFLYFRFQKRYWTTTAWEDRAST